MNWARTVRTEEWRYTLYPGEAGEQLFHICEDIDETRNLAGETGHAETRAALRDRLLEELVLQDFPHPPRDLIALGVH